MAKSVRDAMTADPRSIGASASIVEAARLMREQHIGSLPVTEDDRLVGMITDRDITTRVVAESAVPETESIRPQRGQSQGSSVQRKQPGRSSWSVPQPAVH